MSEEKNQNKFIKGNLLNLSDVEQIGNTYDFLKQESSTKLDTNNEDEDKKEATFYRDINEYICNNPKCQYLSNREDLESLHLYEVDADHIITICDHCYNKGYRFCLFTHEVLHIDDLDNVLDGMYAQPHYHQNQLRPEILSKVDDLDSYFQMIGIDNPNPTHHIIDLTEEDDEDDSIEN